MISVGWVGSGGGEACSDRRQIGSLGETTRHQDLGGFVLDLSQLYGNQDLCGFVLDFSQLHRKETRICADLFKICDNYIGTRIFHSFFKFGGDQETI